MMEALEDIKAAWDNTSGNRDVQLTLSLADQLVNNNPQLFTDMEGKDLPDLVNALEVFRDAGMEENEWLIQAYIFCRFEFQNIGGTYQPRIRTVNNG